MEDVGNEMSGVNEMGKCKKKEKEDLDEEPDIALLLLHLWAAAVGWAEARHGCRGFFNTSTHAESS